MGDSTETSLTDVRKLVARLASSLDPASRYLPELSAVIDASSDVADLVRRLAANSRGARHAGAAVFEQMTLEEKLRCNLVTNETVLFRFSEGEWGAMQGLIGGFRKGGGGRVLCAPCSHGEEAFSVAAACLEAGVGFSIDACDVQPACLEAARRGRMTMGFPEAYLETPAVVSRAVLDSIRFEVVDLLLDPGEAGALGFGPWDLVVCRNFLGYFVDAVAERTARHLAGKVAAGGALFLDSFSVAKFPWLPGALAATGLRRQGSAPVFERA